MSDMFSMSELSPPEKAVLGVLAKIAAGLDIVHCLYLAHAVIYNNDINMVVVATLESCMLIVLLLFVALVPFHEHFKERMADLSPLEKNIMGNLPNIAVGLAIINCFLLFLAHATTYYHYIDMVVVATLGRCMFIVLLLLVTHVPFHKHFEGRMSDLSPLENFIMGNLPNIGVGLAIINSLQLLLTDNVVLATLGRCLIMVIWPFITVIRLFGAIWLIAAYVVLHKVAESHGDQPDEAPGRGSAPLVDVAASRREETEVRDE